ncbi:hypothetical protein [Paractinoplanes maris]|uniref:hypothetical protein n=1 Tax=Paractinoplanes maris TaxID=1734446 RepID=UPI002021C4E8|nr:hypothetical protein [Actinoplanes maris]
MRALHALLRALRTRRKHPETDPIATPDHPGLADLLDAARAPATPEELAGEHEMVAAFVAHRRSAARSERRRHAKARIRAVLVPATTGLALLILTGTAVAARTGNLPQGAQQHAHSLFSALGVPAPGTGTPTTPSPSRPGPRPSLDVTALTWCQAWGGADRPLSREDRRRLSKAAGGEKHIGKYCRDLHRSASASPSPSAPPSTPVTPSAPPTPAPLGPSDPVQPGLPATSEPVPTATPPSKPGRPTHTGKPTDVPRGTGKPSKSREPKKNTDKHNAGSPGVAAPTTDSAERGQPE